MNITSIAVVSLLLGTAAPVYAQHEQQDEKQDHPEQQQSKPEQARPQQHAQEQKHSDQNKQQQHAQQQSQQNKQQQQHAQQQSDRTSSSNSMPSSSSGRGRTSKRSNGEAMSSPGAPSNSSMSSRRPGKSIAHEAGSQITATGSSEAGTTAIAFRTTAIEDILARTTGSAFTDCRSWSLAGIHASSTRVIGLALLTHGRSTGRMTGTTPTLFT
jgi:hypothetical protein